MSEGCPEAVTEFTVEVLGEQLCRNLILSRYTRPTPVQKYSIPIGLTGGDMMACAQTGSGKTGGFLFPVIASMLRYGARPEPEDARSRGRSSYISALILAPTRELASQIYDEAQKFSYCTGLRAVCVYGGANILQQTKELDMGADLLVATPGKPVHTTPLYIIYICIYYAFITVRLLQPVSRHTPYVCKRKLHILVYCTYISHNM